MVWNTKVFWCWVGVDPASTSNTSFHKWSSRYYLNAYIARSTVSFAIRELASPESRQVMGPSNSWLSPCWLEAELQCKRHDTMPRAIEATALLRIRCWYREFIELVPKFYWIDIENLLILLSFQGVINIKSSLFCYYCCPWTRTTSCSAH